MTPDIGKDAVSHHLLINDFLIRVEGACKGSDGLVRFISQREIIGKVATRRDSDDPLLLKTRVGRSIKTTRPDMLFGLEFTDRPTPNCAYFFGEADRGTIRQNTGKKENWSANYKKYEVYYNWWKNEQHKEEFLINNFRVLFYTSKKELRARNLIHAVEPIYKGGRAQWLFTWADNLFSKDNNILEATWLTGKGESTTLTG